jgi:hypothetical protein
MEDDNGQKVSRAVQRELDKLEGKPRGERTPTNEAGAWAFGLGIAGLFVPFIPSLFAIVLGAIGLGRWTRTGVSGTFAGWGFGLGIVGLLGWVTFFALFLG